MNPYLEKIKGFGAPRKSGQAETKVEKVDGTVIRTTEHWDGRQDVTVTPDVVRYGAQTHSTGKKKGTTAEVREFTRKEREERYGPDGTA